MAVFKSEDFILHAPSNIVSAFLSKPANLIEILPQERIEDWHHSASGCSFKIVGLAHISLNLNHSDNARVSFVSSDEKPFSFCLNIHLEETEGKTKLNADFDAEVNAFMATMLKGPLTNFLNSLGKQLDIKYSQS